MLKRIALIFILALTAFSLAACKMSPPILYEDSFDELDIGGRINDAAGSIHSGVITGRTYGNLNTIKEDLDMIIQRLHDYNSHDSFIEEINDDFKTVADLLISAADAKKKDDDNSFESYFNQAKDLYETTNTSLNRYKRLLNQPNEG